MIIKDAVWYCGSLYFTPTIDLWYTFNDGQINPHVNYAMTCPNCGINFFPLKKYLKIEWEKAASVVCPNCHFEIEVAVASWDESFKDLAMSLNIKNHMLGIINGK